MLYPVHLPLGIDAPKLATLTHPNDTVWELELHAGAHHTLSISVITQCLMKALDITEKDWRDTGGLDKGGRPRYQPGAFVIVGPRGDDSKYFSRGGSPFTIVMLTRESTRFALNISRASGLDPDEVRSPGFTHRESQTPFEEPLQLNEFPFLSQRCAASFLESPAFFSQYVTPWYCCISSNLPVRSADRCLHKRARLCWRFLHCARVRLPGHEVRRGGFND